LWRRGPLWRRNPGLSGRANLRSRLRRPRGSGLGCSSAWHAITPLLINVLAVSLLHGIEAILLLGTQGAIGTHLCGCALHPVLLILQTRRLCRSQLAGRQTLLDTLLLALLPAGPVT
jgi:hypothetical protein